MFAEALTYSSDADEPSDVSTVTINTDHMRNAETTDCHDKCGPLMLQHPDDDTIYTSIERPGEQKQISEASDSSSRLILSNPGEGDRVVYVSSINGQMVEYLFEPTDQQFPGPTSSSTAWHFNVAAKLCEMLLSAPCGSPVIATVGAPFFGNQYAGDEIGILEVSWQKSFL